MTAPSPHLLKDDQFSAVQRHPENPYHYFIGTNHSVVIMDERFPHNPLLKWHHSLGESIKHLDVVTNAFPGSNDILLVCGGYQNHNVHCYQYCHGENSPYSLGMLTTMGGLPPQSTSSPWKVIIRRELKGICIVVMIWLILIAFDEVLYAFVHPLVLVKILNYT